MLKVVTLLAKPWTSNKINYSGTTKSASRLAKELIEL